MYSGDDYDEQPDDVMPEEDGEAEAPADGDDGGARDAEEIPRELREIAQELLRYGYIEGSNKRHVFSSIIRMQNELNGVFAPFDLQLKLDEYRAVAYLATKDDYGENPDEEWSHPLVRKHRLTTEQSLLVAILRQFYLLQETETGVGMGTIKVQAEDLLAQLKVYFGDSGSDLANRKRLDGLLENLKQHGIVYEADRNDDVVIRPLIVHMANPDSLSALLTHYESLVADDGVEQ